MNNSHHSIVFVWSFPCINSVASTRQDEYMAAVDETKEHIQAGDIFQLVLSQRFERRTQADPFEIYRCCFAPLQGLSRNAQDLTQFLHQQLFWRTPRVRGSRQVLHKRSGRQ